METPGGQPDHERLPAASGDPPLAKPGSARRETAQYNTPGAPPNGSSTNEAPSTVVNAPAISLSSSPSLSQTQKSSTLEEILSEGAKEERTTAIAQQAAALASLEQAMSTQKMEGEPATKRMRLDSIGSEQASLSPVLSEDQSQIASGNGSLLSQRTLSQSSSLSDSTSADNSALSPDIQSALAQLSTPNLDIATRRNLLLGRTKNKYVCEVCGRECPSKHKLKRHLSTHSEERPFSCQICGKSFKWTEYLQKHMRQQHPGGVEGSPQVSNAQTPTKSPLPCSHATTVVAGTSQPQTATSSSSSTSTLPSPSVKSPPILSPTLSSPATSRSGAVTPKKSQPPQKVDSGVSVNMDEVLSSVSSTEPQLNSSTPPPKPTKQNASVGVNMDEEEELAEQAAMTSATHLTPLGDMNQDSLTISMGGANLDAQSGAINMMSGSGEMVGGATTQLGGMDSTSGGQLDSGAGLGVQVARGGDTPHHVAMDSSGMCYATASMSQPLTTFTNGNGQQQVMGDSGMMQGYSNGSIQTSAHVGQQGDSLQQPQPYAQDMLQQPLAIVSFCSVQDMTSSNSIPVSDQYSIPADQQQQAMQVYSDQQMAGSHSMSDHDPNSMSVGGLHSMTPSDLIGDSQPMGVPVGAPPTDSDAAVMMQDVSQMTQYTNYSMQDPMNSDMYGTESVTTQIQPTSAGVVPQPIGNQYPQVVQPSPVTDPLTLGDSSIAQTVAQTSNVYANVASYETLSMQGQGAAGGVAAMVPAYSNSQQSMMVQTQTDMMGGYDVMHNGLLPTQQDMGVGVMDPAMYGGDASNGDKSHQQQEIKKEQQQADNFISQQIKKHIMRSQTQKLQSHDSHVTNKQPEVTGGASLVTQQKFTTSGGMAKVGGGDGADEKPLKILIVHEVDSTVERYPVVNNSKKETIEIGIQCELGPETIKALIEEERELAMKESEAELHGDDDDGCQSDEDNSNDKTVQKYPCEINSCGKAYIHRKDLIRHMKIRHGRSPLKLEPVTVEAREKPYLCPVGHCGRSYYHLKDLRRHQRLCHKVTLQPKTTSALKDNVEVDEDCKTQLRYPCDFPNCLRSYVHKKDLVRHKRLYHKDTAPRPTIPIPVRYTESELKRIKQEVKNEIDKSIEKIRLDSTGSTASNATASGGEDPPNSALLIVPEAELSKLEPTTGTKSSDLPVSVESAVNTNAPPPPHSSSNSGARFVLFIDPNTSTSSATLVPTSSNSSSSISQPTTAFQQPTSTSMVAGTSTSVLPVTESLSLQSLSKAILSSMTANLPPGQAQLDSTSSLVKMAMGEQADQSLITSEVASILSALEQAHLRQLAQQQQQQHHTEQQASPTIGSISADILGMGSFVSSVSTPTTATPPSESVASNVVLSSKVSPVAASQMAVSESKPVSVLESLQTEMNISHQSSELASAAASLHQLFTAGTNQEPSKISPAT